MSVIWKWNFDVCFPFKDKTNLFVSPSCAQWLSSSQNKIRKYNIFTIDQQKFKN